MAYRADFYSPENIIGFTGSLHNNPTVYFQTDTEFGHITQSHDIRFNIGREPVGEVNPLPGWEYKIENNADGVGEEWWENGNDKQHIHTSRNPFYSTQRANLDVFALLSQAIWFHTEEKPGDPAVARRRNGGGY